MHTRLLSAMLICVLAPAQSAYATAARTFVGSKGADSNISLNCGPIAPCRTFSAALSVTSSGGEVIVLDSAGYGAMQITQSVTISAPDGVYVGIAVPSIAGTGIGISSAQAIRVILKGLTINSTGGTIGIDAASDLAAGSVVEIDHCALQGFDFAIVVESPVAARISHTDIRRTGYTAVFIGGGASATLDRVRISAAGIGVYAVADANGSTSVTVTDTVVSNGSGTGEGFVAESDVVGSLVRMSIKRSQVSEYESGTRAYDAVSGGLAHLNISESLMSGNSYGIYATGPGASVSVTASAITGSTGCGAFGGEGAVGYSFGNNVFANNTQDSCGTASMFSLPLK